ncbi:glycoside hydrolase family 19 protein [Paracoccus sp. MC1854]|uniref:glycoside hydrolase family 19 protein n=1 Tax=Paracoccus sp. MC1854 TaxID=2760306 RepID=UPI001602D2A3|nr:glycoside hydrolase family 19 protein [Paracoccus sp. MC1854]MBB1492709.1 glycoside hydrolase family 19 protein [Paracoccus sp. MC1854]
MAQIATETGGFVRIDENMNYSAERLRVIFPRYVKTSAQAQRLARRPVAIANWVYGGRLGNRGQTTMDGWNYRGSGFLQLTGRDNYIARGSEVGLPLADNPELARRPKEGLQAAVAYWAAKCNTLADSGTLRDVRRCVNGGTNGLDEARLWHGRATRVFGPVLLVAGLESENLISEGIAEEIDAAKAILERLGYYEPSGLEAADQQAFEDALEGFSLDHGLPYGDVSGGPGVLEGAQEEGLPEDLLYELSDPQNLVEEREASEQETTPTE